MEVPALPATGPGSPAGKASESDGTWLPGRPKAGRPGFGCVTLPGMRTARGLFGCFLVLFGVCVMIAALTEGLFLSILWGWLLACFGWWAGDLDRLTREGF